MALAAAACALLLQVPSSTGQDGEAQPEKGREGSGIAAVVIQVDGTRSELKDVLLEEESLGIVALTRNPTDAFKFRHGKAVISVDVLKIGRIDLTGDAVRVTSPGGEFTEGVIDKDAMHYLVGRMGIGKFTVAMKDVKTVSFTHPAARPSRCPSCKRLYSEPSWKFCPHDGGRLRAAQ